MLIKKFRQLSQRDVAIAGGKGASLGEMTQNGIPVPEGFVILSDAFEEFLRQTDLNVEIDAILKTVSQDKMHTVEHASEKIQYLITKAEISNDLKKSILEEFEKLGSRFVAVRSSATSEDSASAAWAGQLDSYLNTNRKTLLENVQKCWASLFTPRAIFYRFEKKLNKDNISVAVVVQKMVQSEKSGIAFSVHPVSQDENQLIIEAGFGLGEAIVSGSITPDSYVVDKFKIKNAKLEITKAIIDINVSEQSKGLYRKPGGGNQWKELGDKGSSQVLNEREIVELSKLILKIENLYGFPCDIEWAREKGKFYIVQSRPITTLERKSFSQTEESVEEYTLHTTASGFSILSLDKLFNNNVTYGEVDYLILYENNVVRGYLSSKGIKECYDLSTKLLDDDFFEILWADSKELHNKLKKYHTAELNSQNVLKEWKKSLKLNDEFCKTYRFYEQPFQQAMEEEILRVISKDELVEMLSKYTSNNIKDAQTKKYLKRLIQMGEMKLRLHKDSEKYFVDNSFVEYVAKKNDLSIDIVNAMRKNEIEDAITGDIRIEADELKERTKGCVFVKEKGKWNLYTGSKFSYWREKLHGAHDEKVSGDIAFRGKAKGKVAVHLSWTDVTEVEEGDVLVAGMTNPQMIPMLKKVAAIVTDEGGITCHAAIISRELKIPCIVGTQNATTILKNGDLVEVDAEKGVVRILQSNKNEEMITKKPEGGGKKADFKIMYDQTQYTPIYWLDSSVPKEVYDGIEEISGYKPEHWLLYGQAVPEAFFFGAYSGKSLQKESAQGLVNLRDRKFLQEFEKQYKDMYKKALKIKKLYEENFERKEIEAIKKCPEKVAKFLEQGKALVMNITKYYLLTQPQRFYDVEKELGDVSHNKALLILMENGRSLSPVAELRYQVLSFSEKIKKSGMKPGQFIAKNAEDWERTLEIINSIGFLNQGWLGGEIVDEKNFLKEVGAIVRDWKNSENEFFQLKKQRQKIEKRKKIFEKNKTNERYRLAEITGQMLLYRMSIHTYLLSMNYHLHRMIDFIFSRYGVEKLDGCSYYYHEIIELLMSGRKLSKKTLIERQMAYLIKFTHEGQETFFGKQARARMKEILDYRKKEINESVEAKGAIASISTNQHFIRGRAFVLSTALGEDKENIKRSFKDGDILIATQTHPHLISIMKRAKAIVADEGGLTCHAAIVSRELGKTCIIGTRIGTKIFKTGDTVELDMKRGVIKKIK